MELTVNGELLEIAQCPREIVSDDWLQVVELAANVRETHTWPEPGGLLDQVNWFREAAPIVWREMNKWKSYFERRARR